MGSSATRGRGRRPGARGAPPRSIRPSPGRGDRGARSRRGRRRRRGGARSAPGPSGCSRDSTPSTVTIVRSPSASTITRQRPEPPGRGSGRSSSMPSAASAARRRVADRVVAEHPGERHRHPQPRRRRHRREAAADGLREAPRQGVLPARRDRVDPHHQVRQQAAERDQAPARREPPRSGRTAASRSASGPLTRCTLPESHRTSKVHDWGRPPSTRSKASAGR